LLTGGAKEMPTFGDLKQRKTQRFLDNQNIDKCEGM
jgi:hypothetical protein